jgi:drug/metabolite transporter (DMT)-like permease
MGSNGNKNQVLAISAVLGAILGLAAGVVLLKRVEDQEDRPTLTAGEGVSLGLLLLGVFRQLSRLGEDEKKGSLRK